MGARCERGAGLARGGPTPRARCGRAGGRGKRAYVQIMMISRATVKQTSVYHNDGIIWNFQVPQVQTDQTVQ